MRAHRNVSRDPFTGVQIRIGVMDAANEPADPTVAALCRRLGRTVAERGTCLLTGACPGLPHESVLGAKEIDGHVVGISPAATLREHVEVFGSPYREYDVLIFTGLRLMGRELVNIRSSDIVVVIGGRSGTLGEFAIAYEEGKLIGVLTGTGRITEALGSIETSLRKDTGAEVIYDDAARLIDRHARRDRGRARQARAAELRPCSAMVLLPSFNKSAKLPEGETVPVEFLPTEPGEYEFACQMGMFRGRLIVEP